jgi:hypothetical protein
MYPEAPDPRLFTTGTTNTSTISSDSDSLWSSPVRVAANEFPDRIEFIYKQTFMLVSGYEPASERVFKIVFSCVDGKWNKSERIFGEIEPATEERYNFPEQNLINMLFDNSKLTKEWSEFDGDYEKRIQDIKLKNGDIVYECYPNAGEWNVLRKKGNEKYYGKEIPVREATHTRLTDKQY